MKIKKLGCRFVWLASLGAFSILILWCPLVLGASGQPDETAISLKSAAGQIRQLNLGFNVGFLEHLDNYAPALARMEKDGFSNVRVYYPWTRTINGEKQIVAQLRKIVDSGFTPLLGVSDFPYGIKTDETKKAQWMDNLNPRQRDVISRRQKFMNLFPPEDMNLYAERLDMLLSTLGEAFGNKALKKWFFEVGNEPNSPIFFWGNFSEFSEMLDVSLDVFQKKDPSLAVGGCGFTAKILTEKNRNQNYLNLIDNMAGDGRVDFISFHVYENVFSSDLEMAQQMEKFVKNLGDKKAIVSEWNVDVEPKRAAAVLDSPDFMNHLIKMVYNCYLNNVSYIYVHKLMDNPREGKQQLGLLSADGRPKAGYGYYKTMKDLLKAGFYGERRDGALILYGQNSVAVLAEHRIIFDLAGRKVVESSFPVTGPRVAMEPGMWLIAGR